MWSVASSIWYEEKLIFLNSIYKQLEPDLKQSGLFILYGKFFDILVKKYELVLEASGTANPTELVRFRPCTQRSGGRWGHCAGLKIQRSWIDTNLLHNIVLWSNGRTPGFDPGGRGSNPRGTTIRDIVLGWDACFGSKRRQVRHLLSRQKCS